MNEEKRRKYCEGITSEEFIKTGKPQQKTADPKREEEFIKKCLKTNEENTKIAIREFKPWIAKRKGPEYKIRFE